MWQKIKNLFHLLVAVVSNVIFGFPGRKMTVIGVTGTDGKTTTVNLIHHILISTNHQASMLHSIGAYVDGKMYETGFHTTSPRSVYIQRFLKKALDTGSKYFVLEVTSHALDQHRAWGIPFKIGVLTNVTSEHLDYHKTFDNYLKTKEKLLVNSETAVVNRDDSSYTMLSVSRENKKGKNWVTYGLTEASEINPSNFPVESDELIGEFNRYNMLAAAAVCNSLGVPKDQILKAIKTFKMPLGRMDFVHKGDFTVLIDFAHTPNAFEQLLSAMRPITKGKIIHVFGSAGERDRAKRPFMGEVSSKYSDILVLTAEDPRSENVSDIINDIEKGVKRKDAKVVKIPDRKEAINGAIEMAQKGDMVIVTGKAHEKSMTYGSEDTPWDEYKAVNDALKTKV